MNDEVGITGLAFSDQSELLASYNDDFIYLFFKDHGRGPHPAPPPGGSAMDVETGDGTCLDSGSPSHAMDVSLGLRFIRGITILILLKG